MVTLSPSRFPLTYWVTPASSKTRIEPTQMLLRNLAHQVQHAETARLQPRWGFGSFCLPRQDSGILRLCGQGQRRAQDKRHQEQSTAGKSRSSPHHVSVISFNSGRRRPRYGRSRRSALSASDTWYQSAR